jgi:hypothetical protein
MPAGKEELMRGTYRSPNALALFRLHVERHGDIAVDDSNREAYEELRRAGLMAVGHTFLHGRNTIYGLTKEGFERTAELLARAREAV